MLLDRLKGTANSPAIRRQLRINRDNKVSKICDELQSTRSGFIDLAIDRLIEEYEKENK
tara:strand:- start:178 stop:354 length:177 start_codon:yes stop_codon:yes gene_type:complete